MTSPENRTPHQHRMAMISALETFVPVMAGAVHYSPSPFCEEHAKGGETMTETGRQFAGVVYRMAVEAHEVADDAAGWLKPSEPAARKLANEVLERLMLCVLFARSLMEDDLPPSTYVSGVLERIHKEAKAAYEALSEAHLEAVARDEEEPETVSRGDTTTETPKYTLAWVVGILRAYGEGIAMAADAYNHTDGRDVAILALIGERATALARVLWNIEAEGPHHGAPDLGEAWPSAEPFLWSVPNLVLAVEALDNDSCGAIGRCVRWLAVANEAERISRDLMEWVEAHEPQAVAS